MSYRSSHVIKLKLSSQLIGQFGHVTASASCKQPEKHGKQYPVIGTSACMSDPTTHINGHSGHYLEYATMHAVTAFT